MIKSVRCADELTLLTILLPLIGFLLLAFSRGRWSENVSATIGTGSVGLAALTALWAGMDFFANGGGVYQQTLWTWMDTASFSIPVTLVLDGLSLTMLGVVTGVGFLIHMYASGICAVKRAIPLLRLHQPVYRQYGDSGPGR